MELVALILICMLFARATNLRRIFVPSYSSRVRTLFAIEESLNQAVDRNLHFRMELMAKHLFSFCSLGFR